jgi:hypothetical protein
VSRLDAEASANRGDRKKGWKEAEPLGSGAILPPSFDESQP